VVWLALSSDVHTPLQLSDLANRIAKPLLQTAPGAADVRIFGERRYAMRVWIDPDRLAAYRLTVQDVEDALRRSNLEVPAGRIESSQREFNVTAATDLQTPEQFRAVALRTVNGQTIRLGDVARVQEGPQEERTSVRYNGRHAISLGVIRQATANPLALSAGVYALLDRLRTDMPPGVTIEVANDNSIFIDRSIKAVYTTIVEAVVLVALVIFVFLRTLRASIIPLVTIPVSLIGTFALMALFGFSINTLTLLALVLAIGLVVDDAIVVLENVYRYIEQGMKPFEAAIRGAREVGFAVIAMTLTLAAVYAPLAFTPGRTGRLFTEFALVLAGAVLVSGFVALTLTPMMCSKLLRHNPKPGRFDRGMERVFNAITRGYAQALAWTLGARWLVVGVMLASGLGSWALLQSTKQELAPMEDRGVVIANINGPDGATMAYTQRYAESIERIAAGYPELDRIFSISGNPTGHRDPAWQAVGRARAQHAADGTRDRPAHRRAAWRERLRLHPAVAGSGLPIAAGQLCDRHLRQLPKPLARGAHLSRRTRQKPRLHPGRHRPAPEQARDPARRGPRARRRHGRERGRDRPHGRDAAWRAQRHPFQTRRRAIRRGGADRKRPAQRTRGHRSPVRARARRRHDSAGLAGHHPRGGGAARAEPFRAAPQRHHHRQPGA
jgi:multidrug efflux pump subunit AcrB